MRYAVVAALSFALLAGLVSGRAFGAGTDYTRCTYVCAEPLDHGVCPRTEQRCPLSSDVNPPAAYSFGAIAFEPVHAAFDWSESESSRAEAEKDAMTYCAKSADRGTHCEIAVWFENRCGAVASGKDPDYYWSVATTEAQAKTDALKKCTADKAKECKVYVSHCSFR